MLDASQARIITEIALAPDAELVKPYLEDIDSKIRIAAENGKREIIALKEVMDSKIYPTRVREILAAVRSTCETLGFHWRDHHPEPDSPVPYTTISW